LLASQIVDQFDGISEKKDSFLNMLSVKLCAPLSMITINANYEIEQIHQVDIPYPFRLSRHT
jgi:hypothetical protein